MSLGYRVLHVDNDPDILFSTELHLRNHGIHVISRELKTPGETDFLYRWADENPAVFDQYSALVLDQRCCGTQKFGEEFAAFLRSKNIDVPVIVFSGEISPADIVVSIESGAIQAAITKPDLGGLEQAIQNEGRRVNVNDRDVWL